VKISTLVALFAVLGVSGCGKSDVEAAAEYSQACISGDLKGLLPNIRNRQSFCDCLGTQMRVQEMGGATEAKQALLAATKTCKPL